MKRLAIALLTCLITGVGMAQQPGRVKITLVGAQCNKETADDALERDGKRDEVFFNFSFVLADRNGNPKFNYQKRTLVYGDATGPFANRINAGSAKDLFGNKQGGIQGGDIFYCNELMGEYDIAADDVLTIVPTIWEWDGGNDIASSFLNVFNTLTNPIGSKATQLANTISPTGVSMNNVVRNAQQMLFPSFTDVLANVFGKPGDRPIGMAPNGSFGPQVVILKPAYIQQLITSNFGYGNGVISVNYNEDALGNTRDHGNYTILIRVEYVPKAGGAAPPPPPSSNNGYVPPPSNTSGNRAPPPPPSSGNNGGTYVPPPPASGNNGGTYVPPPPANSNNNNPNNATANLRKLTPASTMNAIAGRWAGTYTSGSSPVGSFYSFQLNADGTMQLVDQNNNVIANGTYKFVNDQFSGTYKYTNAGSFSVAATPGANGILSGTWGSEANTTNGGKWTMTKK